MTTDELRAAIGHAITGLPSSTEQPAHLHRLRQRLEWPYASYDQAK